MVDSFINTFQQLKTVLCICPHCNSMLRLSDLHLRDKGKSPTTFLDEYDIKGKKLDKKEETVGDKESNFSKKEREIKEKAVKRGRSKVLKTVLDSMDEHFTKMNYNPYDIKPILHPVDFVIYDGMNDKKMKDVVFLSKKTKNPYLNKFHTSINEIISKESYDFQVARIDIDGNVNFE
jgi:predicted Holliday junction resolvase-like endonuclease